MKGVIYYTIIKKEYDHKNMEHMIGEKLLEAGLKREYNLELRFEPRGTGEHGKPFLTLQPKIHYNITHSGDYVACILCGEEVGIDIQIHRKANYEKMLKRMVPDDMVSEILDSDHMEEAFFTQWVFREAYIKWTGEGLLRNMKTIPMEEGSCQLLKLQKGYSGAVWSRDRLDIRWEYVDVSLEREH